MSRPTLTALGMLFLCASVAQADFTVLLSNLDQSPITSTASSFVGQSFVAGTTDQILFGAQMQLDSTSLPSAGITLEVEARNTDGTVGTTLFSNFTSSYDHSSHLLTFQANSPFLMTSGTGYWLVLSDPTAGGVVWDFTASNSYQSTDAYGLPSFNTSWTSDQNNGNGTSTYYQPSDGPQLFSLLAPVPEPSSIVLMTIAVGLFGLRMRKHIRLWV